MEARSPEESLAACLAGGYHDVTWREGLLLVRGEDGGRWLRMADLAIQHRPYMERVKLNVMLDAEIGG